MSYLSKRLVQLKTERNLLQKDIATGINIGLRTYQRYETGEREPSASTINDLANYFNVSSDYLLGVGLYSKEELIMEYKDTIIEAMHTAMQSDLFSDKLKDLPPYEFIRIISSIIEDVVLDEEENVLHIYFYYS